jgi:hypothetical protein
VGIEPGLAPLQQRHVRRRAADIRNQCVGDPGEPARADKARGRAGKDGLDGLSARLGSGNQRAVALHDHNRRCDGARGEQGCGGVEQMVDGADQAGIQNGGEGAPGGVQVGGKLVAARHRLARPFNQEVADGELVAGISDGELAGNRIAAYRGAFLGQPGRERGAIQGRQFGAMSIVTAGEKKDAIAGKGSAQPGAIKVALVEADQDQADAIAEAFNDGVGRQRGGESHQSDVA